MCARGVNMRRDYLESQERTWTLEYVLSPDSVQRVCISHNYYTIGKAEDFKKLLVYVEHLKSEDDLERVALNIKLHSETLDTVYDIIRSLSGHLNVRPRQIWNM